MTTASCKTMQSTISAILKAHHLFSRFESSSDFYVKIASEPYMPLIIEKHGTQLVIAHYFEQNGDLIADPDQEFEIGVDGDWYPVALQLAIGTYHRCTIEDGNGRTFVNLSQRLKQKSFSTMWARNLKAQGFDTGTILKIEAK